MPDFSLDSVKSFLDWNRYMTFSIALWTVITLVAAAAFSNELLRLCNSFGFILWLFGVALCLFASIGELITDIFGKGAICYGVTRNEYKGPRMSLVVFQLCADCARANIDLTQCFYGDSDECKIIQIVLLSISSATAIGIRFVSNIALFYLLISATTFLWFYNPAPSPTTTCPDMGLFENRVSNCSCWFPTYTNYGTSPLQLNLIITTGIAVVLTVIRVVFITISDEVNVTEVHVTNSGWSVLVEEPDQQQEQQQQLDQKVPLEQPRPIEQPAPELPQVEQQAPLELLEQPEVVEQPVPEQPVPLDPQVLGEPPIMALELPALEQQRPSGKAEQPKLTPQSKPSKPNRIEFFRLNIQNPK